MAGGLDRWVVRSLKHAFTENLGLKVIALTAAIVLFSLIHGSEDAQRSVFVDVVALLPAEADTDKTLITELPTRIKLTLRGSRSVLNSIDRQDLETVQIDLRDPGLKYYYFEPTAFELPAGVSIVQIAPASIPLTWAELVTRRLPVAVTLTGEAESGFEVKMPVAVEPPQVRVRGPQIEVDPLDRVETTPVDVTGLGAGIHARTVRLEGLPPHVDYLGPQAAEVILEVQPRLSERRLESIEVVLIGSARSVSRPGAVDVVLRGPAPKIATIRPDRIIPYVEVDDARLSEGAYESPVLLRGVPAGIEVAAVDPSEVLIAPTRRRSPGVSASGDAVETSGQSKKSR